MVAGASEDPEPVPFFTFSDMDMNYRHYPVNKPLIPLHIEIMQFSVSSCSPSQGLSPPASFFSTSLVLVLTPSPHVSEHSLQRPNPAKVQGTRNRAISLKRDFFSFPSYQDKVPTGIFFSLLLGQHSQDLHSERTGGLFASWSAILLHRRTSNHSSQRSRTKDIQHQPLHHTPPSHSSPTLPARAQQQTTHSCDRSCQMPSTLLFQ